MKNENEKKLNNKELEKVSGGNHTVEEASHRDYINEKVKNIVYMVLGLEECFYECSNRTPVNRVKKIFGDLDEDSKEEVKAIIEHKYSEVYCLLKKASIL